MPSHLRRYLHLIPAGLLASCNAPLAPVDAARLVGAQRQWTDAAISHYSFEVRTGTFGDPEGDEWARVEVRNDSLIAGAYLDGDSLPADVLRRRPTVTELFRDLQRSAKGDTYEWIRVSFDEHFGYPLEATFHTPDNVTDGGRNFAARGLVPLLP